MGKAKSQVEFKKAELIRKNLMSALEDCKSAGKFQEIINQYEKQKLLNLLTIHPSITGRNRKLLETKDEQIKNLIAEKSEEFIPKLIQKQLEKELLEQQDLNQQKQLSQKSQQFVEEIQDDLPSEEDSSEEIETQEINQQTTNNPEQNSPITLSNSDTQVTDERKVILQRVYELKDVYLKLDHLSDKKTEFDGLILAIKKDNPEGTQKSAEYEKARVAIDRIHKNISKLYAQYIYGEIKLSQFKEEAKPYLNEENTDVQTLQSHRGIKQILVNLLAAILGVGVIYGLAALYKGSPFVFKPATDSGSRLSNLEESIDRAIAVPSA